MNVQDIRESVGRRWWTLERFGFTPAKLARRAAPGRGPKVFCVSVPKAGTHLLERALCLHPRLYRKALPTIRYGNLARHGGVQGIVRRLKPGQIVLSHLQFEPSSVELLREAGASTVFMIRDPRDVLVSEAFYTGSRPSGHRLHGMFGPDEAMKERLLHLLRGDPQWHVPPFGDKLARYAGWLGTGALVVRFEDMVGAAGGGSDERQRRAIGEVFAHLGLDPDDDLVASVSERLFSKKSPTFHRGAIGSWQEHFEPEVRAAFDQTCREFVGTYGYA